MTAQSLLSAFHDECDRAVDLVNQVERARTPEGRAIPTLQRNLVFETAFLRVLLAWESYVEDLFLHFLAGRPGVDAATYSPLVIPRSIDVARSVVLGDDDYMEWTSADRVKDRASHWLHSNARFGSAFQKAPDLKRMYKVRNRIAHSSTKSKEDFKKAREHLVPNRAHYKGFGPGMVLRSRQGANRNLDRFVSQLKNAASEMAKGPPA